MKNNTNKKTTHPIDNWLQKFWRPMIAMAFIVIIVFDFIVGPIFWSVIHIVYGTDIGLQWVPETLSGGGIFYAAMGAILGVSAYTRGQEKINRLIYGSTPNNQDSTESNDTNNINSNNVETNDGSTTQP